VSIWFVQAFKLPGAALALLTGSVVVLVVRQFYYSREMQDDGIVAQDLRRA
jgi:hypothetical protein